MERDGKILVCQRRKGDRHEFKWEFPGGKVEHGETPREALLRELVEELNVSAKIGPELARYQFAYPHKPPIELIFFLVTEFQGEMQNRVFEKMEWSAPGELAAHDFLEGDIDFVRRLVRQGTAHIASHAKGA